MTLKQFIEILEATAAKQAAVAQIVPQDVYRLNQIPDAKYGAFAWLHSGSGHEETIGAATRTLRFTLFYVDRLTEDKGNQLDIQSTGLETLSNILRTIVYEHGDAVEIPTAVTYHPFLERFTDECAGEFADVAFEVDVNDICEEL